MWCSDPYVDLLKRHGYCLVRLPRGDIRPGQVLSKAGKDLQPIGDLGAVFVAGSVPVPLIREKVPVASMSGASTGNLGTRVGLSILENVVQAFGGSAAGLDGAYQRARRITFSFSEVLRDNIDIALLDQFLSLAEVHSMATGIERMLDADDLYVVTATLKSNTLTVEAYGEKDSALEVNAPALQQMLGANVRVGQDSQVLSKVKYTGETPLVFGFQAVQLVYENGIFSALKPTPLRVIMRTMSDPDIEHDVHGYLRAEGAFVRLP